MLPATLPGSGGQEVEVTGSDSQPILILLADRVAPLIAGAGGSFHGAGVCPASPADKPAGFRRMIGAEHRAGEQQG